MSKLEQRMKLAKEAAGLIEEFRGEAGTLGHNPLRSVSIKEDGEIIEVDDEFDGFYEAISLAEADLEYDFKRLSKTEFKEYVGNLKYAEYRCEEIYKRLEEIEREALELEE